jgi:hypothetical protein
MVSTVLLDFVLSSLHYDIEFCAVLLYGVIYIMNSWFRNLYNKLSLYWLCLNHNVLSASAVKIALTELKEIFPVCLRRTQDATLNSWKLHSKICLQNSKGCFSPRPLSSALHLFLSRSKDIKRFIVRFMQLLHYFWKKPKQYVFLIVPFAEVSVFLL